MLPSLIPHRIFGTSMEFLAWISGTAVYQSEEDDDPSSQAGLKAVRSDVEERALDPNHNFFVLVDDGTTDQLKGKDAEFRARFERCISLWSCASSSQEQSTTGANQQSGVPGSTTHLQQPQSGVPSSSPSSNTNQTTGALQRQGSTIAGQTSTTSGPQTSATSIGKSSGTTGGSSSNSALGRGATEQSGAPGARGAKDKPNADPSVSKPTKSGKSVGSEEDVLVPMCGLVVGGDRFTLRQVYCSMIRNRCPIVVTKVITRRLFKFLFS
ncbi:unnamed protein product [Trichobilharzia regenti]|nr:unnamed protein product [Trichobilharzia regenti]